MTNAHAHNGKCKSYVCTHRDCAKPTLPPTCACIAPWLYTDEDDEARCVCGRAARSEKAAA